MTGAKTKLASGSALIALAILSFGLSYAHLGHASIGVAFLIAAFKAMIVGAVFMEIGREKASFKLALLAGALLLATLLGFVASDVRMRDPPPLPPPATEPARGI
ncbi:MAG TPA: cytochrome C oxidase subunit IV family protein [Polyangiaceae bacterium]|jgi:caa(3)-type oxidase subunit IV